MSLTASQREALADVRDDLRRSDPELTTSFGRLIPRVSLGWWAGALAASALFGVAIVLLGPVALGVVASLLVLGSPVAVALAPHAPEEPAEPA